MLSKNLRIICLFFYFTLITSTTLIMLKVYKMMQEGATVVDSVEKTSIPLHIISYVDDNLIVRHFDRTKTVTTMMEKIKENIGEWQKLLQLTGGDLTLDKCKVTVMKWYQNGEWGRIKLKKPIDDKLQVTSIKNKTQVETLERLNPHDAERVLGIRLPLDGSMKTEFEFRKQQLKEFCVSLYKSPLTQKEAYIAYQSRYKSISTYPYTVTTFTTKELAEIQKDALNLLLPKLGINWHMPRTVLFGSKELGGREIMDLQIEQPVSSIKTTLGHLRRNDKVAKLLLATLYDLQIEVRREIQVFKLNPDDYGYVTENTRWLYMWKMIYEFQLDIQWFKMWVPKPQYENDRNIMQIAIEDPLYQGRNKYKLKTINQCRLYQRAFFISDLQDANDPTKMNKMYLNGDMQRTTNRYNIPTTFKPTKLQWNEWRAFIYRNCLAKIYEITPPLHHPIPDKPIQLDEKTQLQDGLKIKNSDRHDTFLTNNTTTNCWNNYNK